MQLFYNPLYSKGAKHLNLGMEKWQSINFVDVQLVWPFSICVKLILYLILSFYLSRIILISDQFTKAIRPDKHRELLCKLHRNNSSIIFLLFEIHKQTIQIWILRIMDCSLKYHFWLPVPNILSYIHWKCFL